MPNPRIVGCIAAAALCPAASGQSFWPPRVSIAPDCPRPVSEVSARVAGDWPNLCPPTVVRVSVDDFEIELDLFTEPPPPTRCAPIGVTYELDAVIGQLPAGQYNVNTTYYIGTSVELERRRVASFVVDPECPACYADCDASGELDFFDFLCFQNAFAAGDKYADCDRSGELDFFDFLCYQNAYSAGCP